MCVCVCVCMCVCACVHADLRFVALFPIVWTTDYAASILYNVWVCITWNIVEGSKHYSAVQLCGELYSQEAGQFDLFYYDGLARQEEEIRLTVGECACPKAGHPFCLFCSVCCSIISSPDTRTVSTAARGDDLIPPMELCIRTK